MTLHTTLTVIVTFLNILHSTSRWPVVPVSPCATARASRQVFSLHVVGWGLVTTFFAYVFWQRNELCHLCRTSQLLKLFHDRRLVQSDSGTLFPCVCLSILKEFLRMLLLCFSIWVNASDSGVLFRCMRMSLRKEFFLMLLLYTGFALFETEVCFMLWVSASDSGVLFRCDCSSPLMEILFMLVLCSGFAAYEMDIG
jgi:hypothetical protein